MSQPSLKKNFGYNILYQLLIVITSLVTSPYLTRIIGAEGLGIYTFTQSYAHYFVLFIMLGVNNYGTREIAKVRNNKKETSKVFWEIYSFQGFMLVIISCAYAISVMVFIKENQLIYLIQLMYVISSGLDISWCCFGLEKFKLAVVRSLIIKILSTALLFLLIHKPSDLWIYACLSAGTLFVSQFVVWLHIVNELHFKRPTLAGITKHIRPNLTLFLPVIAFSLYTIMNKLMLGLMDISTEVAFYTYAGRIVEIPETVITALTTVMLPRTTNMIYTGKEEDSSRLFSKSMQLAMLFSFGASFGLASVSDLFIPWYYGEAFSRCSQLTIWLCPVIIFNSWNGIVRNQHIIPKGYNKVYLLTVTAGALINFILNYLMIPTLRGIGAVIGTVATQFTVCLVQYILTRREINYRIFWKDICAFCVSGIVMAFALACIPMNINNTVIAIFVKVVIGAVIYVILSFAYLIKVKKDTSLVCVIFGMLPGLKKWKRLQ